MFNSLSKFKIGIKNNDIKNGLLVNLIIFSYYKKRYYINIDDYFKFRLYDLHDEHVLFKKTNNAYTRKWKYTIVDFMPNVSKSWELWHYIDFLLCMIIYPGLDARDYFQYQFYNFRHRKRKTFVTEKMIARIDKYFNGTQSNLDERKLLDNKPKFNQFLSDIVKRDFIIIDQNKIEEIVSFCLLHNECVFKPLDGLQGKGIFIKKINFRDEAIQVVHDLKYKNYMIEEKVIQAKELNDINSSSVNTIRVISVKKNDVVYIMNAALRVGCNGSPTDNFSSGGICADIDLDTGIVCSRAVSKKGKEYYIHPETKKQITGLVIPNWSEVKVVVQKAHMRFKNLGYIAWDIAIKEDHTITIIEANTGGGMNTQQFPSLKGYKLEYERLMRKQL